MSGMGTNKHSLRFQRANEKKWRESIWPNQRVAEFHPAIRESRFPLTRTLCWCILVKEPRSECPMPALCVVKTERDRNNLPTIFDSFRHLCSNCLRKCIFRPPVTFSKNVKYCRIIKSSGAHTSLLYSHTLWYLCKKKNTFIILPTSCNYLQLHKL